ncbi:MAG TPA: adenylosuccinate lyase, partial [Candidatus Altiarchaeales archaeon]|nr:adenylosuccinate lyase [Candidatus Altiarchaeales archaeon]
FLEEDLLKLKRTLLRIAKEKKTLVCVARTHGQHALPTTYGLKFAIFAAEVHRHIQRLEEIKKRILVGKMSGAVGTQAAFGAKGIEIQKRVMNHLGLKPALVSNQVLQRDRHAEFIFLLALISQTLSKIALEIRNLQRSEIDEVREHFVKEKQVGSSTMPHKRNPIIAERICGLSRVIKASVIPALDNIPLWHERDLTNSSCERIIIPETCILTDYILNLTIKLLENLDFNEEAIRKNLELSKGRIMAEAVMIKLVERGMGRQDAHELVRKIAIFSEESNISFKEALLNNREITRYLKPDEIEEILKPENYIGTAVKQVEELIKLIGNEN